MTPADIKPIHKLLVANRGEIAIRVLRAATELGIRTVALFTHEDRYSLHRYKADEAYQIGEDADALKPYLNIEEIIALAKRVGADCIHPGYGFLAENVDFARRCGEEGLLFVGPSPESMERLGNKVAAKEVARSLGIPMIEDNLEPLKDEKTALKEAKRIGYPIILKAAAGGGGRGMRVVQNEEQLKKMLPEAKSEAKNAFGDDTVFMEKYVSEPKHIEVQILGDKHGSIVHLFERDCSVQRRFQKVVEIAPAPTLGHTTKQKLYEYALRLATAVGYYNAGTVEFLVDPQENIYFIEVNPRIQVEHTVTEEVTGIDIVRTQILIAQGYRLADPQIFILNQASLTVSGYAIQCRITTEDPLNNFIPDYGRVIAYRHAGGFNIRLDEGNAYPGAVVSPFFDSMIVKVTASGRTLKGACQRMQRTLSEFRIRGVKTNIPFLQNLLANSDFQRGHATVNFIAQNPDLLKFDPSGDRGTRTLKYLANVIVNGNPDVKNADPTRTFHTPRVPHFDRFAAHPAGSRNILLDKGPEGLVKWVKDEKRILYTDTTFRDAHQSLLATRVRTADMLRIAEGFAKHHPEVFSMEMWGGATFDVCLRFLKESPWERLQLLREAMPNVLFQMLFRGSNGVGYAAYPDNLIQKTIVRSWETGIDIFRIFDSLNWVDNMLTSIRTVREETGGIAEACICYTGEIRDPQRPKYNLEYYIDMAKRLEDAGSHILCIKDMAGLLKPYSAELLVKELRKAIDIPIHLHTHDTAGIQSATYLKAVEAGVDIIDVCLASMSGLTSQPNFNSLAAALEGTEREMPINLKSLNAYSNYWEAVREYYYPFESGLMAGTAEVYEHEIPGGQYSNLRPQAEALGLGEQWEEIKENFKAANLLFGDIVKVTPSSKVVGDMALFMTTKHYTAEDILTKGDTLSFPDSVKALLRGDIGQQPGGFPEKLQAMVLKGEKPFTDRPNAHLAPVDFDKEFAEFQTTFGPQYSDLDFLSYKLYPKVFQEYHDFIKQFGSLIYLPTLNWFYGMQPQEEALVDLGPGKRIIVKYLYRLGPDLDGKCRVFFELNGQTRSVDVVDQSATSSRKRNAKATAGNDKQIGSPLQGKLSRILVKPGDKVKKNQPLFVIEAMKMESNVVATADAKVDQIILAEGSLVETDDLVVVLA